MWQLEKSLFPYQESNLGCPTYSVITTLTELSQLRINCGPNSL